MAIPTNTPQRPQAPIGMPPVGPQVPLPPMANCQTCDNGHWITQMFPTPNGQCPPGWEVVDGSNPCNVLGEPGITNTFVTNISSGYNQFGCSFLYNRKSVLQNKLMQLIVAGTNPAWQDILNNKLIYIDGMIAEVCTMTATSGPNGTTLNVGPLGPQTTTAGPELPASPEPPTQIPGSTVIQGQPYVPPYNGNPGQPYIPAQTVAPGQAYTAVSPGTMAAFNGDFMFGDY